MSFEQAWSLIQNLLQNDLEVVGLLFGSILALRAVKVLNPGVWSQLANLLGSAVASGLFKNVSLVNGLKMVFFSAASALLYHLWSKIIEPNAQKLIADMKAKK